MLQKVQTRFERDRLREVVPNDREIDHEIEVT